MASLACQCGTVQLDYAGTPLRHFVCHCVHCQASMAFLEAQGATSSRHPSGGDQSLFVYSDDLRVVAGAQELTVYSVVDWVRTPRVMARCCHTAIASTFAPTALFTAIKTVAFQDPADLPPLQDHINVASAPSPVGSDGLPQRRGMGWPLIASVAWALRPWSGHRGHRWMPYQRDDVVMASRAGAPVKPMAKDPIAHFWMYPGDPTPGATEADLQAFEARTGRFVATGARGRCTESQNGGTPRWAHHPRTNGSFDYIRSVEQLGFEPRQSGVRGTERCIGLLRHPHYQFMLDYARSAEPHEPAVVFVDLQRGEGPILLAESFASFAAQLRWGCDTVVLSLGPESIRSQAVLLERGVGAEFMGVAPATRWMGRAMASHHQAWPQSLHLFENQLSTGQSSIPWCHPDDVFLEVELFRGEKEEVFEAVCAAGLTPQWEEVPPEEVLAPPPGDA